MPLPIPVITTELVLAVGAAYANTSPPTEADVIAVITGITLCMQEGYEMEGLMDLLVPITSEEECLEKFRMVHQFHACLQHAMFHFVSGERYLLKSGDKVSLDVAGKVFHYKRLGVGYKVITPYSTKLFGTREEAIPFLCRCLLVSVANQMIRDGVIG